MRTNTNEKLCKSKGLGVALGPLPLLSLESSFVVLSSVASQSANETELSAGMTYFWDTKRLATVNEHYSRKEFSFGKTWRKNKVNNDKFSPSDESWFKYKTLLVKSMHYLLGNVYMNACHKYWLDDVEWFEGFLYGCQHTTKHGTLEGGGLVQAV